MLLPLSTKRQLFKEHDLVSIETALPLFNLFSADNLRPRTTSKITKERNIQREKLQVPGCSAAVEPVASRETTNPRMQCCLGTPPPLPPAAFGNDVPEEIGSGSALHAGSQKTQNRIAAGPREVYLLGGTCRTISARLDSLGFPSCVCLPVLAERKLLRFLSK
ncbi:elongin-C isoform X1 [Vulpes lagopus]|uniref:elongin-C isoform X1 n=1 Tax=Vulpes lagopus TaxID=494514 RepID=UPI001BC8ED35|nr:elongin-C isoform X1 [Vulpes lagopus]